MRVDNGFIIIYYGVIIERLQNMSLIENIRMLVYYPIIINLSYKILLKLLIRWNIPRFGLRPPSYKNTSIYNFKPLYYILQFEYLQKIDTIGLI